MKHLTHRMHGHSVAAFRAEEVKLGRRAQAIVAWIEKHGPHTDREVAAGMGFDHRSAVQPRITELIESNQLMEVGDVACPVTGKRVRRVDIRRPRQPGLFS